jgi:acetyltransferase-like isoleucine patch superfamily enzyme
MKIHPLSDVQTKQIGIGTEIWQFVVILEGAKIGANCNINSHCFIENDVIIGDNVTIKCGVNIWDGIRLENNVFIGPAVTFINDKFPRSKRYPEAYLGAYVEEGASIGANATIMANIRIGKYSMIGAGSVVTRNIPNNTIWIGNPARMRGYICDCGYNLDSKLSCIKCNTVYKSENGLLSKK